MPLVPPRDFIQYRPTGLHNAMLAPCFGYGISGFLWYQGESNTRFPESYEMYMRTLVRYVREKFDSRELPFGIVQLANFDVDLVPVGSGWPEVREAQRRAAIAMNCGLAVILDVGESNDLHPLDKKSIGERLADYMLRVRENKNNAGLGPELDSINWNETGTQCRISFKTCNGGLATKKVEALNVIQKRPDVEDLQSPIEDAVDSFVLSLQDGRKLRVQGQITDDTSVNLTLPQSISRNDIASIQYAYENNPIGNLLCNSQGYLASPFLLPIAK